jgi:hypothetical protein
VDPAALRRPRRRPWFQPRRALQRAGVPLAEERGTTLPAVPYDAVIEPGDLVHCDVGLSSLGLRTDTQRNGYVLRPGDRRPGRAAAALAVGNRMQDLTTAALRPAAPATRCWPPPGPPPRPRASTATSTPTRSATTATAPGRRSACGTSRTASPGAGDRPLHPDTVYALELCVRHPVPEWGGQLVRMALEQGIALTDAGVEYLDGRQTELILIPGG